MDFFSGINTQETSYELGGGSMPIIPKDTSVLAVAEEAVNSEYQGERYINVKWRVSKPDEYANYVIFQKIRVYDADPAKAEKAKRMLAAIATNAGGKLFQAMQKSQESEPSDMSLMYIANKPMVLKIGIWMKSKDDNGNPIPRDQQNEPGGNWVQAVSPYTRKAAEPQAAPKPATAAVDNLADMDDSIPF